jgi:hypothetical protein
MGVYYLVVNPVRREFLDPSRFGEGIKFSSVLGGPFCCLALKQLICDGYGGAWIGDPVVLAGDDSGPPNPAGIVTGTPMDPYRNMNRKAREEFANISYRCIADISCIAHLSDSVTSQLVDRAAADPSFLIDLINVTFQYRLPHVDFAIRERFGTQWRREYDRAVRLHPDYQPLPAIDPPP